MAVKMTIVQVGQDLIQKTRDSIAILNETQTITSLKYPLTVGSKERGTDSSRHASTLVFYAVRAGGMKQRNLNDRATNFSMRKFDAEETIAVVQLPMVNLNENIQNNIGSTDTDFMMELIGNMTSAFQSSSGGTIDKASAAAEAGFRTTESEIKANITKKMGAYNAEMGGNKVLGNRQAELFKGTALRTQTYLFPLRPRNLAELKEVGRIIATFQSLSVGEYQGETGTGGVAGGFSVYKMPPLWYIEEKSSSTANRYTPKHAMGPCTIQSVRISKDPNQLIESFAGTAGDPVAIDLEVTVQEVVPVHKAFFDNINKSLGSAQPTNFLNTTGRA